MVLESLKLDKFTVDSIKKEQMVKLNGGKLMGMKTGSGVGEAMHSGHWCRFNYAYDSARDSGVTLHGRTNIVRL